MSSGTDDGHPFPPPFDPSTAKAYALSGRIMMSAIIIVFAVVVIMLILHVYARWYILRNNRGGRRGRTHLVFYVDSATPDAASAPSRGLDPDLLKSLPTFVFSSAASGAAPEEEKKLPECAVCLSEFEDGEKGRVLPKCKHSFHVDCIDMWFHSHTTCPLCRSPVDREFPAEENDAVEVVVESARGESTHPELGASSGYCADCRPGPSSSSSFSARRKGLDLVGVSVEIPARTSSFRFPSSDELGLCSPAGQGFKSPTSRLLQRILSREKKPIPSPTSPGIGASCSELADIEEGRVETRAGRSQSQATTPR